MDRVLDEGAVSRATERRSLLDTAYGELKRQILSLELAPGTRVLEEELAGRLGMSRTPVREAAIRLQQDGLIEIVPRKGFRVTPLTKRSVQEVNEVLECLEIQAAERLAARRIPAEHLKLLEEAVEGMDRALEGEDPAAWAQADYLFHSLLIELCGNSHLAEVARTFLDKAHRFRLMTLPLRAKPVYSNVNHAAVVEAVRRHDPQTAQDIHRAHKRRWARELTDLVDRLGLPD